MRGRAGEPAVAEFCASTSSSSRRKRRSAQHRRDRCQVHDEPEALDAGAPGSKCTRTTNAIASADERGARLTAEACARLRSLARRLGRSGEAQSVDDAGAAFTGRLQVGEPWSSSE